MQKNKEVWKTIEGYENYSISSHGNVKRNNGIIIVSRNGKPHERKLTERSIKPYYNHKGYLKVHLQKNGSFKNARVHRLVGQAFLSPPKSNQTQINHKNGVKDDNYYENLEWASQEENYIHALENNLTTPPKPVKQLDYKTGKLIKNFPSITSAMKETGIKDMRITEVCKGKRKSANGFVFEYINEENKS